MTKAELYQKACMLPLLPGVYIIRDKSDTIIYIGKAKRLRIRVSQYFREGVPHDNKVSQMIAHAYAFDVIVCQSEFEALVLEASQIKAHTPKYNILLKDDKGYSYIRVTREEWPRLSFTLQKEEDGAEYIGPYTSSFAARQMAETAMDAFLLPRCSKRFPQEIGKGRPCLNAHIGKCMAVCSGKISCETYNQAVKNAVHLIRYGKKEILKTLNERMQEASDRLEFETAALLRDQINAITKLTAGQKVVVDPDVEMDVVALAGTPDSVCAAVLRFREGRLTDKREFLFHDTSDIDAVREEFLPRYYLDDEQIPKIIAVDALPPDVDALQQALNQKRGSEVQLYVPQRGDKAHLVEMAHTNAVERLARESGRYAREEKLLDELAQVLGLSKPPRAIESYDISNWGDGSSRGEKVILGVPGYPVSGIIVIEQLLKPLIDHWLKAPAATDTYVNATLTRPVVSGLKYQEFVRVRMGCVGGRLMASPLSRGSGVVSSFMKADGILEVPQGLEGYEAGEEVSVRLLSPLEKLHNTLVIIGSHDPLLDELADMLHLEDSALYISSSHVGSMGGIMAIRRGEAHMAGCHLLDTADGSYNKAFIRKYFPKGGVKLVSCVGRQQGLMVAKGNPLQIRKFADIAKDGVRYVNRQKGSGTRILADYLCMRENVDTASVYGYDREELTHTSVAAQIASGSADVGMGIYSAAKLYDLDFIPICIEEYDLIVPDHAWDTPMVQALLHILKSDAFRGKILSIGGYTVDNPGQIIPL